MTTDPKFVCAPRDEVERVVKLLAYQAQPYPSPHAEYWQGLLDKPAEQHQGEPVALPMRDESLGTAESDGYANGYRHGWNAYQEAVAKLGPLYTHADLGEVERLRADVEFLSRCLKEREFERDALLREVERLRENHRNHAARLIDERGTLRAQLAERDAQLGEVRKAILAARKPLLQYRELNDEMYALWELARQFLSASAEPSAPAPMPAYMEAACDKFDWTPEEALRFYAEGKHFDVVAGRTRILCTGAIASHALKGMSPEYADMKGSEPNAPVERDERAAFAERCDGREQEAFEAWAKGQNYDMACHPLHWLFLDAKTYSARQGWAAGLEYATGVARAALERKA